ncbi:MAG: hypothetical protein ACO1N0_08260 [Fluviicola sp.]
MYKFHFLFFVMFLFSGQMYSQGYFESLSENADYLYVGFGFQHTALKSGYYLSGTEQDDAASGVYGSFAWEEYGDERQGWLKLDGSLLFDAVLSGVSKYRGPSLKNYEKGTAPNLYKGYLINNKFLHGQASWTFGKSNIGPLVSFGWEGVGLVEQLGKKGGSIQDGVGEENAGLISMGTGLNWIQPFSFLPRHSRLTIGYDWFLNRKNENKFWFGGASRGRISVDFSMVLARRVTASLGFAYFNFKNAYNIAGVDANIPEDYFVDSRLTTFKLGLAYNIIAR